MTCTATNTPARLMIDAHWLAAVLLLIAMGGAALTAPAGEPQRQSWHGNVASRQP